MALNLSTLTNPATSGGILAEALTTADFLDPVPILKNLARGSQKGGDAKQTTALNQPKALPLVDGKGYLYLSGVSGNYASVPHSADFNGITDFVMEAKDVYMSDWATGSETFFAKYGSSTKTFTFRRSGANINFYGENSTGQCNFAHGLTGAKTASIRVTRAGTSITAELDTGSGYVSIGSPVTIPATALPDVTDPVEIGARIGGTDQRLTGKIGQARIWKNATASGTPVLDVDFTATNIRHGDTKFKCATGQVVTINKSGNDPATVIKKSVLRFDGHNDGLDGLFASSVDNGYMFAAFSVLGTGGENYARVFTTNESGQTDVVASSWIWSLRNATSTGIGYYNNGIFYQTHTDMYDDARGDYLHEHKVISGYQKSAINNADLKTTGNTNPLVLDEFHIGVSEIIGDNNAAIDLEYLALFPASITDAEADSVRNYINNRNNVFSLIDSQGYYFFDPQALTDGDLNSTTKKLTGLWDGRIVGSDNGDTSFIASQGTSDDQPTSDKYTLTFADNTDHLTITNPNQAGWQVVGTSLGTFAYRVNNTAVTELNLLGNAGFSRAAGDSFGMLLLPESATGADIEQARKLLIDRGAADGVTATSIFSYWRSRDDIVEFKNIETSSVTSFFRAWRDCTSLTSFPAIDASSGTTFIDAFKGCSSLTSFPAGAKLGTSASNVNFSSAWRQTGLTSFSTPLPTANNVDFTWVGCSSLTSFSSDLSSATTAWQAWVNCYSLESFTSALPLVANAGEAWANCNSLESFTTVLPLVASVYQAWYGCSSLTDFPSNVFANWNPASISSGVFHNAWFNCTSLTAQSVENILVSIDASGHYATTNKVSGGPALADAGIDIDYNVATGSLSAATNTAVTSLKAKGWSIVVNGVTL